MTRRLTLVALVGLVAAAPAGAASVRGYDGTNPFACELQRVGTSVDLPRPGADPLCVEYDKTQQNVEQLGIAAFLAGEPTRFAVASDKCFYFQADHWRGAVEQDHEQSETYNWDGRYFFDKARGVAGFHVERFTLNNVSFDPTALPLFPAEHRPFFGYGRGGMQLADSVPVEPRCVEKASREPVYAGGDARPAAPAAKPPPRGTGPRRPARARRCTRPPSRKGARSQRRAARPGKSRRCRSASARRPRR